MKQLVLSSLLLSGLVLSSGSYAENLTLSQAYENMVIEFSKPESSTIIIQYSDALQEAFDEHNIDDQEAFKIHLIEGTGDAYKVAIVNFGAKTVNEIIKMFNSYEVTDVAMIQELEAIGLNYQGIRNWRTVNVTYFPSVKKHTKANINFKTVIPWAALDYKYTRGIYLYDTALFDSLDLTPAKYTAWVDFGVNVIDEVIKFKQHGITLKQLKTENIHVAKYEEYKTIKSQGLNAKQLAEITSSFKGMRLVRFNTLLKNYPKATPEQMADLMTNRGVSRYKHWYNHGFYDPTEIAGYQKHKIFRKYSAEKVIKVIRLTDNNFDLFWAFLKENDIEAKEALSYIDYKEEHPTFDMILEGRKARQSQASQ